MWPTSEGERTLQGTEAVLVANAIATMVDVLIEFSTAGDEPDGSEESSDSAVLHTGISVYDSLSIGQRIGLLHRAARHLLTPAPLPTSILSAVDDASVAAIFCEIRDQVGIEIDCAIEDSLTPQPPDRATTAVPPGAAAWWAADPDTAPSIASQKWRRWVVKACQEVLGDVDWQWPTTDRELGSVESSDWDLWVECLASAILWDRDFEFIETFLDAEPDAARSRRLALGIADEYFVSPAPDPLPSRVDSVVTEIRKIVRPFLAADDSPR